MTNRKTERADEAAAAYWRSVAATTKPPEHAEARAPLDENQREVSLAGAATDAVAAPSGVVRPPESSATATARRPRRRL